MSEVVAYSVDRTCQLVAGQVIDLVPAPQMPAGGPDVAQEWPDGLSRHGVAYTSAQGFGDNVTPEWFFELVRRAEFGESQRSRFESVFAFPTLADARAFRHSMVGSHAFPILRVQGELLHRANMTLIRCTMPAATTLARAREYWRGEVGIATPPVWELLLAPPVRVLDRVGEDVPSEVPEDATSALA